MKGGEESGGRGEEEGREEDFLQELAGHGKGGIPEDKHNQGWTSLRQDHLGAEGLAL